MKKPNATTTSANGAASYQPRATPWVRTPYVISPEGAPQLSHQGKNPCNRASSSQIKANGLSVRTFLRVTAPRSFTRRHISFFSAFWDLSASMRCPDRQVEGCRPYTFLSAGLHREFSTFHPFLAVNRLTPFAKALEPIKRMANYNIIGGDGKEYGPVTEAEIRQWVAEGRLNATSQAKSQSDSEWRALGKFPELADLFGPAAKPSTPPPFQGASLDSEAREIALSHVRLPALILKISAVLNLIMAVWNLFKLIFGRAAMEAQLQDAYSKYPQLNDPQVQKIMHLMYGPLGVANAAFTLVISILIWIGASKMQELKSYEFAFVAAVLAMVPCLTPCCFLGLPFGIWALVVLLKSEVKSQF